MTVRPIRLVGHTGRMDTGRTDTAPSGAETTAGAPTAGAPTADSSSNTPLHLLADASREVAATSKRGEKTARLALLFQRVSLDDLELAVGLMLGRPHQGRIGIGWATVSSLDL